MTAARVKSLLVRLGFHRLVSPVLGGAGAVLVLHRVRPRDPQLSFAINHQNSIAPDQFCALLEVLAAENVPIISLDEAAARLLEGGRQRFVCLTFDDGYRDNYEVLLPIVQRRRIPITIYIAPGLIDGTAPLWWYALDRVIARETRIRLPLPDEIDLPAGSTAEKERVFAQAASFFLNADAAQTKSACDILANQYGADFEALAATHMMSWVMVKDIASSPLVEIGAHTVSHLNLSHMDESTALCEMAESRARLAAETGRAIRHFAYPFGTPQAFGAREQRLADELGFATAVSTQPGNLGARHGVDRTNWPRHGVGPQDGSDALRLKLAGVARAFARA